MSGLKPNMTFGNRLTSDLFIAPVAIIMAIAVLYLLGYMVYGSLRKWNPSQTVGEREFVGLRDYIFLFNDATFRESLLITLVFAAAGVIAELITGVGLIMATGMLLAIPPIIFTLFAARQIITGMTVGAVKG